METLIRGLVQQMGKPPAAADKIIQIFEEQWISSKEDLAALTESNYRDLKIPMGFAKKMIERIRSQAEREKAPKELAEDENGPQPMEIESSPPAKPKMPIQQPDKPTEKKTPPLLIGGNAKVEDPKVEEMRRKLDQEKIKKVMDNMSSNVKINSEILIAKPDNTDFKPTESQIQMAMLQNHYNEMENLLESEIAQLSQLQTHCGSPNKLRTMKMLKGICEKILKQPDEPKFRRINIGNKKVKAFVWDSKKAQNVLGLVGFKNFFEKETKKNLIVLESGQEYLEYLKIADIHLGMRIDAFVNKNKYGGGGVIRTGENGVSQNLVNYVKEGVKSISERIQELKTERRILRNRHEVTPVLRIYHALDIDRNEYTNVQCKTFHFY